HRTLIFSTSALRYAPELSSFLRSDLASEAVDLEMRGPNDWDVYGVHVIEPVVCAFGPEIRRVRASCAYNLVRVDLRWRDGRSAHLTVNGVAPQPFEMTVTSPGNVTKLPLGDPVFFDRLFDSVIAFFQGGPPPVPRAETLAVVSVLESVRASLGQEGRWIGI